jgi:DNA-nicking Smr family endonuclease
MKNPAPGKPPADDSSLLEEAFKDVAPLPDHGRALHAPRRARPLPYQTWRDEREALAESLTEPPAWDVEFGDETYFLRPGLPRHIIRNLRRGHWVLEAELDLHGMNRMEARLSLGDFLNQCLAEGLRCVRVIHGKGLGSRNREPVLKAKVRHWLSRREEVLAFSQARPVDGGSGALVVLLKAASRSPR